MSKSTRYYSSLDNKNVKKSHKFADIAAYQQEVVKDSRAYVKKNSKNK
jgi:hypothetical protein